MKTETESNGCNPKAAYHARAQTHPHPVAKRLFEIAETKKSNLIISADFRTTAEMLKCAYDIGPYIAVFKTHIDMISDFSDLTINGLRAIARTHNFLIFEDRKFVDIGHTVIGQYHGGALRISEWADIVNLSILGGEGIVDVLDQTIKHPTFPFQGQRALLLLAEMTSQGSLAGGEYTERCVELAARYPESVIGFVATKALTTVGEGADFVTFTTGVNRSAEGDELGQQYQTPRSAVLGGSDFIIAGRGILCATSPVAEAIRYRREGWEAYLDRTGQR